jgi:hypothetical protein
MGMNSIIFRSQRNKESNNDQDGKDRQEDNHKSPDGECDYKEPIQSNISEDFAQDNNHPHNTEDGE